MENKVSTSRIRRTWTQQETRAFLRAYSRRKEEFSHPKRKKYAWQNLVEDLTNENVFPEPITALVLENKMKSLLRAYKQYVDNFNQTGAGKFYVPFQRELEEIFGSMAIVGNSHRLSVEDEPVSTISSKQAEHTNKIEIKNEADISNQEEPTNQLEQPSTSKKRKVSDYFERKLAMKEAYYNKKIMLQKESNAAEERRHKENLEVFSKLVNILLGIERAL